MSSSPEEEQVQYKIFLERDHTYITFIVVCFYDCSILLIVNIVHFLLCLIYKLNFIIGMYV